VTVRVPCPPPQLPEQAPGEETQLLVQQLMEQVDVD
jgi:hypothetical protein